MILRNQSLCPTHRANQLQQPENNTEYAGDDHQGDRCSNPFSEVRVKARAALKQVRADILHCLQRCTTAQQDCREGRSSQRRQNHRFNTALLDDMHFVGVPVKRTEPDDADDQRSPENRIVVTHPVEDQGEEILERLEKVKKHQDEDEQQEPHQRPEPLPSRHFDHTIKLVPNRISCLDHA